MLVTLIRAMSLWSEHVHLAFRSPPRGTHHARRFAMMKTVKHTFTSIGDHGGDFARTIGSGTVGLARRVGDGTAGLARRIGPRRALIGLAVAAVTIGGTIVLVRYLRARNADRFATGETGESADRGNHSGRSHAKHTAGVQVSPQG
jgi:hypothetical protein